jgi:hypothetical protein
MTIVEERMSEYCGTTSDSLQDFPVFSDNVINFKFFLSCQQKGVTDLKISDRFIWWYLTI